MDPNSASNMTGEPNQTNRSSVFGFDAYPPPYVNWSQPQPDVFANPANPVNQFQPGPSNIQPQMCIQNPVVSVFPTQILPEQQITPDVLSQQYTITAATQQQMNFSFGAPKPTQDVVQFPFPNHGFSSRTIRCKRKTDSPPLQPMKQHITEEKMAEHMSNLHISSETATSSKESDTARTQRLYLCEEMRKLQTESILPQSLMARIQRPCTALVLWKPPARILPLVNNEIDENENNNEQQLPDNNAMANESEMENDVNNMDMDNC